MVRRVKLVLLAAVLVTRVVTAASFDCGKASLSAERLVCASPTVSRLDEMLQAQYDGFLGKRAGNDRRGLIRAHRTWLQDIRNGCADERCLVQAYATRLAELGHEPLSPLDLSILGELGPATSPSSLPGFSLVLARDKNFCDQAGEALQADMACRNQSPDTCQPVVDVLVDGQRQDAIQEVASNEYGYTMVSRSTGVTLAGSTLVYVDRFQGGRFPRLQQTHLVNSEALAKVYEAAPGPVPYPGRHDGHVDFPQELHSQEFEAVLASGKKIADGWWPMVNVRGKQMLLEYTCTNTRYSEGDPYCPHIRALTFVRLAASKQPEAYCRFEEIRRPQAMARPGNR